MTDHEFASHVIVAAICLIALVAAFGAGIGPDYETTPRRVICRIVLAALAVASFCAMFLAKG